MKKLKVFVPIMLLVSSSAYSEQVMVNLYSTSSGICSLKSNVDAFVESTPSSSGFTLKNNAKGVQQRYDKGLNDMSLTCQLFVDKVAWKGKVEFCALSGSASSDESCSVSVNKGKYWFDGRSYSNNPNFRTASCSFTCLIK